MPVNDIYQARIVSSQGAQVSYNIRHYQVESIVGVEWKAKELALQLDALFAAHYKALLSSNTTYRGVGARQLTTVQGIEQNSIVGSGVGTATGSPIAKQVAGLITLQTTTAGRHGRGRVFLPFPAQGDSDTNGAPSAGYLTRLALFATDLITTITYTNGGNTTVWYPGVYRRSNQSLIRLLPGGTALTRTKWATQRRRGDYGRTNLLPF